MARNKEIPSRCLVLDSGAVIGLSRGAHRARAVVQRAVELGMDVRIPVVVLAETLRGGPRDAPVHRVRNAVDVFPTTETVAKLAAGLLGQTGGKNTVDALVAAEAMANDADILTSDPEDMRAFLPDRQRARVIVV